MADHVPANLQCAEFGRFVPQLLRTRFAEIAATGVDEQSSRRNIDVLRHGDQPYGISRASRRTSRGCDAQQYGRVVGGDAS